MSTYPAFVCFAYVDIRLSVIAEVGATLATETLKNGRQEENTANS